MKEKADQCTSKQEIVKQRQADVETAKKHIEAVAAEKQEAVDAAPKKQKKAVEEEWDEKVAEAADAVRPAEEAVKVALLAQEAAITAQTEHAATIELLNKDCEIAEAAQKESETVLQKRVGTLRAERESSVYCPRANFKSEMWPQISIAGQWEVAQRCPGRQAAQTASSTATNAEHTSRLKWAAGAPQVDHHTVTLVNESNNIRFQWMKQACIKEKPGACVLLPSADPASRYCPKVLISAQHQPLVLVVGCSSVGYTCASKVVY